MHCCRLPKLTVVKEMKVCINVLSPSLKSPLIGNVVLRVSTSVLGCVYSSNECFTVHEYM